MIKQIKLHSKKADGEKIYNCLLDYLQQFADFTINLNNQDWTIVS